jgi:thioredoxin reductase (NADPH)
MSSYLIDQIDATPNIEVLPFTEILDAEGDGQLKKVTLSNRNTKEEKQVNCDAVFVFIGAKPYTEWLEGSLMMDKRGFIYTGRDLQNIEDFNKVWKEEREPHILETCIPGIFAAGDVRSGAMNRVASAVGEGSMSISLVHRYLNDN